MSTVTVSTVSLVGDDVLRVEGSLGSDPAPLVAYGWASAVTNYYPPNSYDAHGSLLPGATPRVMTDAERLSYYQGLLASLRPEVRPLEPFPAHA